jgi:transcriptional regulator with XRE-family HTH domain
MLEKKIAEKIRHIRKVKGLTLAQLGEESKLSSALLSRIENYQVSPPIATLAKIARGLNVPISVFFEEEDEEKTSYFVTPKKSRKKVVQRGTKIGFVYYSLTGMKSRHVIEPFIIKYPALGKNPSTLFDHPGEEFVYVLKGKMELIYGDKKVALEAGDAIHFDSSVPHRGRNVGTSESECLVVVVDKTTDQPGKE